MSKAFTKEDGEDAPIVVPGRVPLPPGTPNYVTARGLALLRAERDELVKRREQARAASSESTQLVASLGARLAELEARLTSAVLVEVTPDAQAPARFGSAVRVRAESGAERSYRIVGVDEADAASGLIAFVAPLARALLGKRVGDVALVRTPNGEEELELLSVE